MARDLEPEIDLHMSCGMGDDALRGSYATHWSLPRRVLPLLSAIHLKRATRSSVEIFDGAVPS